MQASIKPGATPASHRQHTFSLPTSSPLQHPAPQLQKFLIDGPAIRICSNSQKTNHIIFSDRQYFAISASPSLCKVYALYPQTYRRPVELP
jgi:hypothetical protein